MGLSSWHETHISGGNWFHSIQKQHALKRLKAPKAQHVVRLGANVDPLFREIRWGSPVSVVVLTWRCRPHRTSSVCGREGRTACGVRIGTSFCFPAVTCLHKHPCICTHVPQLHCQPRSGRCRAGRPTTSAPGLPDTDDTTQH